MQSRSFSVQLYWYPDPSPSAQREAAEWMAAENYSDVAVIGISDTVVTAFATTDTMMGWGTSEPRANHPDLSDALTAVVARLRAFG